MNDWNTQLKKDTWEWFCPICETFYGELGDRIGSQVKVCKRCSQGLYSAFLRM